MYNHTTIFLWLIPWQNLSNVGIFVRESHCILREEEEEEEMEEQNGFTRSLLRLY